MIPFLLHARLSGAGGDVADPPGWNGVTFSSTSYVLSGTATALASFRIKSDGTWDTFSDAGAVGGNWFGSPGVGVGSGYEVRYTITSTFGSGTVVNEASTWTSLSADRTFSIQASRSTNGTTLASRTVTVEIRPTGGAVVSTSTFTVSASAEVGS